LTALLLTSSSRARAASADPAGAEFFENKIRPLLVDQCYKCHSEGKKKKGGLLLDTKQSILKGGDNGPAVVAGDPEKSRMIEAVRYKNADLQMPPDGKLSDAQIADLEAWVKMGAPDPRGDAKAAPTAPAAAAPTSQPSAPASTIDFEAGRKWWAFQPPKQHAPPAVKDATWAKQPIDRFVLAKLEERG
jgi:hypothetical protein